MNSTSTTMPRERALSALCLAAAVAISGCAGGGSLPLRAAAPTVGAESLCNAFLGRTFEGAVVTRATFVSTSPSVPEHCVVRGEMPRDLDFEVRLPSDWNRRTVFVGGGGFDGNVAARMELVSPGIAQRGYATISTNHGHTATTTPGATFALDSQMLKEYAYLAVPRVLGPAKAILSQRYGDDFTGTKLVYEGCSGGGRQALLQAQRYPDLFDGVIARAPAIAFTPQFLWYQKVARRLAQPSAQLSTAKMRAISDAVMAKCDALDGLKDGIIGRPQACAFDPVELACKGPETDSCLTPAQVESARTFYAPTDVAEGRYTWPGFLVGGEFSSHGSVLARGWDIPARSALGEGYFKYMVAGNPSVEWLQIDPVRFTPRIDQLVSMIDAVSPDLNRFRAHGGKLIVWTGLSDWLVTANSTTKYYESVVKTSGGQAVADEFVEYYTAPGVQHCGGGTGADRVDLIQPLFDWLEKGIKPATTSIIAAKSSTSEGVPALTRPLCKYPLYPKFRGGDPNAASSFVCVPP